MTDRVASLGMYDGPELAAANDALWSAIAARLRAAGLDRVPDRLDRTRPVDAIWGDPGLVLAQACGYPLATEWRGRLRYVATPRYRVPGCEGVLHRSLFVVRHEDPAPDLGALRGRRAAVNAANSNSGLNLLRAAIAPLAIDGRFFAATVTTGSHRASVAAVAAGEADIAAIDCVTFAHLGRIDPAVRQVRVLARSVAVPGLPLVTAATTSDRDLRAIRRAVRDAARDIANGAALETLAIDGIEVLRPGRYDVLRTLERRAVDLGYATLR